MVDRQLAPHELRGLAEPLVAEVRRRLGELSADDPDLLRALRQKLLDYLAC